MIKLLEDRHRCVELYCFKVYNGLTAIYDCQDPKTMKKIKGKQMASETQETNGIEANATDE